MYIYIYVYGGALARGILESEFPLGLLPCAVTRPALFPVVVGGIWAPPAVDNNLSLDYLELRCLPGVASGNFDRAQPSARLASGLACKCRT